MRLALLAFALLPSTVLGEYPLLCESTALCQHLFDSLDRHLCAQHIELLVRTPRRSLYVLHLNFYLLGFKVLRTT